MVITKKIINLVSKPVKVILKYMLSCSTWDQWAVQSWSQEGEDMVLKRIFEAKRKGFYVDVGAHHPKRFSNTYLFYKRGWSGINIDAMPGSMSAFQEKRPRDINLEIGIGEEQGELEYYIFNEPALNGFSRDLSLERNSAATAYRIEKVISIKVRRLSDVMDRHLATGQQIDFMSIDVEGLDLQVLRSNDWINYRPTYVLAEVLASSLHEIEQSEIGKFMRDQRYILYAKCMNTIFFKESSSQ